MHRIASIHYQSLIASAYALLPNGIEHLAYADFLCDISPTFAGLHQFQAEQGSRSYNETMHCVYDYAQSVPKTRQATTIVIPNLDHNKAVVTLGVLHELGHVIHSRLTHNGQWLGSVPITAYAETNPFESFAEAFTAWAITRSQYNSYGPMPEWVEDVHLQAYKTKQCKWTSRILDSIAGTTR